LHKSHPVLNYSAGIFERRFFRSLALLVFVLGCLPVTTYSGNSQSTRPGASEDELIFGVYAHIRSTEIYSKFAPLSRYLERSLAERGVHKRVRMKIYTTYTQAIDALANGKVDFVRYGPVSYILAKKRNQDIRLLALESNSGKKSFSGVFVVKAESPIHSISDLIGRRVAFGNRNSTTGRYLSQAALVESGLTEADFEEIVYLGRHDKVAYAVASGHYDAGAMNENTFNKYKDKKNLRAILNFDCVTKPWVARAGLDAAIYAALRDVLLNLADPGLLKPLNRDGLLPAVDSDYDMIRKAMQLARQFDEVKLTFGTYASQRPGDIVSTITPVLNAIETGLEAEGVHVSFKTRILRTYTEGIDSLSSGAIDIARLGAASYVVAKERQSGLSVLAQESSGANGAEGVFIVRNDAPIHKLQDLNGKTLAFANEHSTEGCYYPQSILLREGITAKNLAGFSYLGRHDKVAFAVAAGSYDAGAMRSTVFESTGLDKKLRTIMRFSIPGKLWVTRQGFDDDLVTQLRKVFESLEPLPELRLLGVSGFVYPPVDDFVQVRKEMARSVEFRNLH
jgi:phosphonate transport system substrate-binding protein